MGRVKSNNKNKKNLERKLAGYSAAAVAALACSAPLAQAAPQGTIVDTPEWFGAWHDVFQIDFNNDSISDFMFGVSNYVTSYGYVQINQAYAYGLSANARVAGPNWVVDRFDGGDTIDANRAFVQRSGVLGYVYGSSYFFAGYPSAWGTSTGNFFGQRGHVGVRFDISGSAHYGWVDVAMNNDASLLAIYGWGYETVAGDAIAAGDIGAPVPEPASLSLLAMGAAGLFAWKGKRKEEDEDQVV